MAVSSKASPETASNRTAPPTSRRRQRFRARRIRVDESRLGIVNVTAHHPTLGPLQAKVEDLSMHGLALVLAKAGAAVVLSGDRLRDVRVRANDVVLYEGTAIVRRSLERKGDLVIGVELTDGGLDLAELYHEADRFSFAERLRAAELDAQHAQVSPAFKVWVADLRSYLEGLRQFLDAEERAVADLDLLSRDEALAQYLQEVTPAAVAHLNRAALELGTLVLGLSPDDDDAHRTYLRRNILPLLMCSPLLRRSYEKPLGYAGDYEMMNMLYRDHAEGGSLFAKTINVYGAQEAAARANINRLDYLGALVRSTIEQSPRPRVRVASIGCGPARELLRFLHENAALAPRLDVALVDQEERAISYCERTIGPVAATVGARFDFIRESIRQLLSQRQLAAALGARDLIYSAGLFDYLNDRTFAALLNVLYGSLEPDGSLVIGNVAAHNPTRAFMEYCLDWYLVHRSSKDLLKLASHLSPAPRSVTVEAEPLGVNLFLIVRR